MRKIKPRNALISGVYLDIETYCFLEHLRISDQSHKATKYLLTSLLKIFLPCSRPPKYAKPHSDITSHVTRHPSPST